ncbi:hypothetical protein EWM64_g3383, partial [Hericium alpestre]
MSGIFDPAAVKATLKLILPEKQWKNKYEHWKGNRENQAGSDAQLTWAANVVAYVNFLWDTTKIPPNSSKDKTPRNLARAIPMHGPCFIPLTYMYLRMHQYLAEIEPGAAYLKPLHIIHPVYYPELLKCPRCGTTDRFKLTMTSAGLAENIRQLHLLEYQQTVQEYLQYFRSCKDTPIRRPHLRAFSAPADVDCYEDFLIMCDKVTDILLEYSEKTQHEKSSEYIRTLTGICVSIDNTFKVGDKATVSEGRGQKCLNVMKGGLLNMISECNNYLGWSDKAKGKLAWYWSKDEQETRLQEMFEHWSRIGGVWTAASPKVHANQLVHVKKGCLMHTREDIVSDGSCIEGWHKGWNSLMQANPSGIVVFVALGHDHVHHCNTIFVSISHRPCPCPSSKAPMEAITHALSTTLRYSGTRSGSAPSHETFGLVPSDIPKVEDELLKLKPEDSEDPDAFQNDPDLVDVALASLADPTALIEHDPVLDPHLLTIAHTPVPLNGDNRDSQAGKGKARESNIIDLTDQDIITSTPNTVGTARPCSSMADNRSTKRKCSSALADNGDAIRECTQKSQKNTGGTVSTWPHHSSASSSLAEE